MSSFIVALLIVAHCFNKEFRSKIIQISQNILSLICIQIFNLFLKSLGYFKYPMTILDVLSMSPDPHIRSWIAKNPHCSPDIFNLLKSDREKIVRIVLAHNTSTPIAILSTLASDQEDEVRIGVSLNPKTPPTLLIKLSNDVNEDVALYAKKHANYKKSATMILDTIEEMMNA